MTQRGRLFMQKYSESGFKHSKKNGWLIPVVWRFNNVCISWSLCWIYWQQREGGAPLVPSVLPGEFAAWCQRPVVITGLSWSYRYTNVPPALVCQLSSVIRPLDCGCYYTAHTVTQLVSLFLGIYWSSTTSEWSGWYQLITWVTTYMKTSLK